MDEAKLIALNWRIREIDKTLETLQKAVDYEEDQLEKHCQQIEYLKVERAFIEDAIFHLRCQS